MISERDVFSMMEGFGVPRTAKVTVRASIKSIGGIEGGADGLIDALKNYLSDGLLLVPTHTWATVTPANPVYDVRRTPPCIGTLADAAAFRRDGKDNFCVGTVEFAPGIAPALELVQSRRPRRTYLAPLMIVAGDHAINDMAGDEPDSWKNRLAALGTETECILKGLGEYPEVRALFVRHARSAAAL